MPGPSRSARRRAVLRRFADLLVALVESARAQEPRLRLLSDDMSLAVVGAVNELVLLAVEEDRIDEIPTLGTPAADLLRSVLGIA